MEIKETPPTVRATAHRLGLWLSLQLAQDGHSCLAVTGWLNPKLIGVEKSCPE